MTDFCHLVVSLFRGRNNEITIIIVFSLPNYEGANNQISTFKIDKTNLEVVEEFSYLGCIFQKSYYFKSNVIAI